MAAPSRILVLTSTFPRWTADDDPPFMFEFCRRLAERYDLTVLAPHYPGSEASERVSGIRVRRFRYFLEPGEDLAYGAGGGILTRLSREPKYYGVLPFFLFSQMLDTLRLIRKFRFDLIHAHWLIPQGLAALPAMRSGRPIPLVCTSHGGDLFGLHGPLLDRLKQIVLKRAAAVTVVSRSMEREVLRLGADPGKVRVLPMGTDLVGRFTPADTTRESGLVLYVGRLVEKKGVRHLISALPEILAQHPHARLLIVGDGPEKSYLMRLGRDLGVGSRVEFAGAVVQERLPEFYRRAEVVAFPSVIAESGDREGFGLVLVEALGCECAVVTTDLKAMQDIVTDAKTGLVVPQKDPHRMAEKICLLLGDPGLARALGRAGRCHVVARFDWETIAQKYSELYDLFLTPPGAPSDPSPGSGHPSGPPGPGF